MLWFCSFSFKKNITHSFCYKQNKATHLFIKFAVCGFDRMNAKTTQALTKQLCVIHCYSKLLQMSLITDKHTDTMDGIPCYVKQVISMCRKSSRKWEIGENYLHLNILDIMSFPKRYNMPTLK